MTKPIGLCAVVLALAAGPTAAQDVREVLQAAAERLGVTDMRSLQYSGTGWVGAVGQNYSPAEDWPQFD